MLKQSLSIFLSALLLLGGVSTSASAAVIGTRDVIHGQARDARIDAIQSRLARADVQAAMVQLGVDPADARSRVNSLTDQELAELETQLDQLPAGGELLAIIGVVFVVLLILELTGVIDIFKRA